MSDSANYMQIQKCECGAEMICFCGRCQKCGTMRSEENTLVGKFKKRWTMLLDLHAREKILPSYLADTCRVADDLFRYGLMGQQDYSLLVSFFEKNGPVPDKTTPGMEEFRPGLIDEQDYSRAMIPEGDKSVPCRTDSETEETAKEGDDIHNQEVIEARRSDGSRDARRKLLVAQGAKMVSPKEYEALRRQPAWFLYCDDAAAEFKGFVDKRDGVHHVIPAEDLAKNSP